MPSVRFRFLLAEGKGFEPLWAGAQTVFKTASLWPLRYPSVYELPLGRYHRIFNFFRNIFRNAVFGCFRSARKVSVYKAFLRFCVCNARKFSRLVPFPQYSRNARPAQQGFISPDWGDTLASKTHRVFSTSLTRYDRFDNPPYMNCRQADIIGYSIFLEMRFSITFGVSEKPAFARLMRVFATVVLANFQDLPSHQMLGHFPIIIHFLAFVKSKT